MPKGETVIPGGGNVAVVTVGTAGSGGKKPPAKPRPRRGGFHRKAGARDMKEYPLTMAELIGLSSVGLAASAALAGGSFFLSTWLDIYKDLSITAGLSAETKGYWIGLKQSCWWAMVGCFSLAAILTVANGAAIFSIVKNTEHPDAKP